MHTRTWVTLGPREKHAPDWCTRSSMVAYHVKDGIISMNRSRRITYPWTVENNALVTQYEYSMSTLNPDSRWSSASILIILVSQGIGECRPSCLISLNMRSSLPLDVPSVHRWNKRRETESLLYLSIFRISLLHNHNRDGAKDHQSRPSLHLSTHSCPNYFANLTRSCWRWVPNFRASDQWWHC